jgi:hypothetical protein
MLDIVEIRRRHSSSSVFLFLKSVLAHPFPDPGKSLQVSVLSTTGDKPDVYKLTRPAGNDYLLDYVRIISKRRRRRKEKKNRN